MLANGGALFVFQKPFAITQADVDAKAEIKVDLVFNPESVGQAHELNDCASQIWVTICSLARSVPSCGSNADGRDGVEPAE